MQLIYKITNVTDRDGNKKELPKSWVDPEYIIHIASVGRSAILGDVDSNQNLTTSTVENVSIASTMVVITTKNTVYTLFPQRAV